jgi:hypothetical protein
MDPVIVTRQNFKGSKFKWLWMKYVSAVNDQYHCTNSIRGKYSKLFSKHNENLESQNDLVLDEVTEDGGYQALYICGVASKGYSQKKNYPYNVHAPILPQSGARDTFEFDGWEMEIENGIFLPVPEEGALPQKYTLLPPEYTTCRIFRWAVCNTDDLLPKAV